MSKPQRGELVIDGTKSNERGPSSNLKSLNSNISHKKVVVIDGSNERGPSSNLSNISHKKVVVIDGSNERGPSSNLNSLN